MKNASGANAFEKRKPDYYFCDLINAKRAAREESMKGCVMEGRAFLVQRCQEVENVSVVTKTDIEENVIPAEGKCSSSVAFDLR